MGSPENNELKSKKNDYGFFQKYKDKIIRKTQKDMEIYSEQSGSKIFYDRIISIFFDLISWIIIGVFVYIWWKTRGQTKVLGCSDISVQACNNCFGIAKGMITNITSQINSIPLIN